MGFMGFIVVYGGEMSCFFSYNLLYGAGQVPFEGGCVIAVQVYDLSIVVHNNEVWRALQLKIQHP